MTALSVVLRSRRAASMAMAAALALVAIAVFGVDASPLPDWIWRATATSQAHGSAARLAGSFMLAYYASVLIGACLFYIALRVVGLAGRLRANRAANVLVLCALLLPALLAGGCLLVMGPGRGLDEAYAVIFSGRPLLQILPGILAACGLFLIVLNHWVAVRIDVARRRDGAALTD